MPKRTSGARDHGERLAALEAQLPGLADVMREGFKSVSGELGAIRSVVGRLEEAEQQRIGAEQERKRQTNRQHLFLATSGGLLGSAVTAFIDWFKH